jgi:hypothetical protein
VDFRFGCNWKKIEEHIRTKTTVQVILYSNSIISKAAIKKYTRMFEVFAFKNGLAAKMINREC